MTTTLVVLAAKMGNKYGGLKQLEGIGPNGETILDYSMYDALKAGFNKVVFVISKYFEEEFKEKVSAKYEGLVEIKYAFQEIESVPEELRNSKRNRLWGSAHAILMVKDLVKEPFGVINATNFYQRESFELLYSHLQETRNTLQNHFLISFRLANALAETGGVTRGICEVNDKDELISIVDRMGVERIGGDPMYLNEYNKWVELDVNSPISMNMWGFTPDIFNSLNQSFDSFIATSGTDLKSDFSIPGFMNEMVQEGLKVKTIKTPAKWMGLVSPDDRIQVILRINDLIRKGIYPSKIFEQTNQSPK
ncbi:sugar phosphate nucleotidyltransferase [uncultured Bacteroides sp.]|uniref:sugar phosphate nucleotidyltransferase n=1 Tax=uncultured Bacteroides sp. TaxID=162156 RepID=UPI002AAC3B2C|nr:sugar phosphate nucleotidyltransferase [uncultured Bacteroides sp.]